MFFCRLPHRDIIIAEISQLSAKLMNKAGRNKIRFAWFIPNKQIGRNKADKFRELTLNLYDQALTFCRLTCLENHSVVYKIGAMN